MRAGPPLLALLGVVVVALLALLVTTDASDPFDRAVLDAVRDPSWGGTLGFLRAVTELGSTGAVTVIAGLVLVLGLTVGPWRHGVIGAAVIGLASVGVELLKDVVARDRPEVLEPILVERGFSFPSGHATLSMVAYGVLAVLIGRSFVRRAYRRAISAVAAVVVLLVGVSRVWLGVHYPTDVIAGWTAGLVIVALYATLTREVPREPVAAAVAADPAGPRSGPPAVG